MEQMGGDHDLNVEVSEIKKTFFYCFSFIGFIRRINFQPHGLAVSCVGYRSYVTGLIHSWSRSHLTYIPEGR